MDSETSPMLVRPDARENNQRLPRVDIANRNGKTVRNIVCTHILSHILTIYSDDIRRIAKRYRRFKDISKYPTY